MHEKASLFRQVNAVLKPDGLFVIADWIFPEGTVNETGPLVYETKKSYDQVLQEAGFREIDYRDECQKFLAYAKGLLENLAEHRAVIEKTYNGNLFAEIEVQHKTLIDDITHHRRYAVRITAKKA